MKRFMKPCNHPGCGELVERGKCDKHRAQDHALDRRARGSSSSRGYDRKWEKLRAWHLAREPLCRQCQIEGKVVAAFLVDHITPIRQGGAVLDPANLQSLCVRCHNQKTARESR
jgi:5-methylcytosine-specific restriction enzyme A